MMEVPGKKTDSDDDADTVSSLDKLCQPCKAGNVNTDATCFCKECEEYMCTACFRQHLRLTLCRDHTLLDIKAFPESCLQRHSRATKCKLHDGESINFYCRKHEAVGCGRCMINNHMACKPEVIKDLSANFMENEEYKTLMIKIEKLIAERKDVKRKIQENKKANALMLEKCLQDVKQFRLDINKYLDKVETDITQQVKNVMEENETLLTKLENDCAVFSTKLEEITNMLDNELYKDDVLFVHMVECKPKLSESETAILSMKSKSMKKYEFVCDERLRSFVSSAHKLGTLAISSSAIYQQTFDRAKEQSKNQRQGNEGDKTQGSEREDVRTKVVESGFKKKEAGVRQVVAIGARVRHNLRVPVLNPKGHGVLDGKTGTVTAVHDDSRVTVRWDDGQSGRFTVGQGFYDVTVIQS